MIRFLQLIEQQIKTSDQLKLQSAEYTYSLVSASMLVHPIPK